MVNVVSHVVATAYVVQPEVGDNPKDVKTIPGKLAWQREGPVIALDPKTGSWHQFVFEDGKHAVRNLDTEDRDIALTKAREHLGGTKEERLTARELGSLT